MGFTLSDKGGDEAPISCFANPAGHQSGDRNPSCSVNLLTGLWKCFGCGQNGNAYQAALALGYAEPRARDLAQRFGLFLERAKDDAPKPRLPNERQLRKWREAMVNYPALINRLYELKGWTLRAIIRCGLGWDGERITFTIRDKKLKRIGVVRYLPVLKPGERKVLALPGTKRGLFPPPETMSRRHPLYIVEGEPAAVSVRSCGLQAVAIPGTQSWRMEFVPRLAGFNLVFLPDCDPQGRDLARRVAGAGLNVPSSTSIRPPRDGSGHRRLDRRGSARGRPCSDQAPAGGDGMSMGQSVGRNCPCCDGGGCSECDGTGWRFTTYIEKDGVAAHIHGSAPLSPESQEALAALMKAAYDHMVEDDEIRGQGR